MNERGITLIELMIVISIIIILVVAAAITVPGVVGKYNIENQIKTQLTDLMSTKLKAMEMNRLHFVVLTSTGYTIYEDTNPAPNGNGTLETATDRTIVQRNFDTRYPIAWNGGVNADGSHIRLTARGLIPLNNARTIWVTPADASLNPEYDCIVVAETRINMGEWNGADCNVK